MSDDESEEPLGDLRDEVESRTGSEETAPKEDTDSDTAREAPREEREEASGEGEGDVDEVSSDGESATDDGPLGGLRRDIESRKGGDPTSKTGETSGTTGDVGTDDEHFAEMDVGDVDTEEVWADLLFEDEETPTGAFEAAEVEGEDRPGTVVSKSLCHRCQYFGDPPALHCTHEGTTIHELVDMDHYRVTECPMVDPDVEEQS